MKHCLVEYYNYGVTHKLFQFHIDNTRSIFDQLCDHVPCNDWETIWCCPQGKTSGWVAISHRQPNSLQEQCVNLQKILFDNKECQDHLIIEHKKNIYTVD